MLLAPFGKQPLEITLSGLTNEDKDLSVDTFRTVTLPLLSHFGISEGLELKIQRRGAPPQGGGEITFKSPIIRTLRSINLVNEGKIKRIRGIAYCTRVSPQIANRVAESSKELLKEFTPNVYIYTDPAKGGDTGESPGYGLLLVAESTTGCLTCVEGIGKKSSVGVFAAARGEQPEVAEDLGTRVAKDLLVELMRGGCVDRIHQAMVVCLMALGPEDVSKVLFGDLPLPESTIAMLRDLSVFFGVKFKIKTEEKVVGGGAEEAEDEEGEEEEEEEEVRRVSLMCKGAGFTNFAKGIA